MHLLIPNVDANVRKVNKDTYHLFLVSLESSRMRALQNKANVWDHMSRVTSRCLDTSNGPPVILPFCFRRFFFFHRVWEGILGIPRDLTKIQSGMWENVRFVDRVRDLTATRGARFAKILSKTRYSGQR